MSETDVQIAKEELIDKSSIRKFNRSEKYLADPNVPDNQRFSLFSLIVNKKPNQDGSEFLVFSGNIK
jgi:hypothetical protein